MLLTPNSIDLMYDPNVYAFADSLEKSIDSSADTQVKKLPSLIK